MANESGGKENLHNYVTGFKGELALIYSFDNMNY